MGYEFSNRRGSEGIHPIQRGKTIAECTKLFDEDSFENEEKASTYIYRAFKGDFESPIHPNLQQNITRHALVDMLTFDRVEFEKNISTAVKKKVKYEAIWKTSKLVALADIAEIKKGTSITQEDTKAGNIPVVAGGQAPAYFHNKANRVGHTITVSASGAYAGFVNFFSEPIFASDCNTVQSKNEKVIATKLIYEFLKPIQEIVYGLQRGQAQPHVYAEDLATIKIPQPPPDVQKKIVAEIEVLEKMEEKVKEKIYAGRSKIETLFSDAYAKSQTVLRLSDNSTFDVSIGKRLLKNEILSNGYYPVFSANVFEPFGYINTPLIEDFSVPSVLWGIDGDWMVNYMRAETPFYPTDHCGVLRVKNKAVNERYLAYVLEKEGRSFEFSRTKRASIDKIQNIKIQVPSILEQQKVVAEVERIEGKIIALEKELAEMPKLKEAVLKKYL